MFMSLSHLSVTRQYKSAHLCQDVLVVICLQPVCALITLMPWNTLSLLVLMTLYHVGCLRFLLTADQIVCHIGETETLLPLGNIAGNVER